MDSHEERPLKEREEGEYMEDYEEAVSDSGGCGCLRLLGFRWSQSKDKESRYLLQQKGEYRQTWWMEQVIKVKQVTEVIAGPKWKTFIRKFRAYGNKRKQKNGFQYDPQSYALNFDSGFDREDDDLVLGFSSRFSAPPPPPSS